MWVLLAHGNSPAQQWWERKPYFSWSEEQADQILNESPWVGLCVAGLKKAQHESLTAAGFQANWPVNYRIRLLSARPVREALLAQLSYAKDPVRNPGAEATVKAGDLRAAEAESKRQAALKELVDKNPEDILVKGDDDYIIVTVCLAQFIQGWLTGQYEVQKHSGTGSDRSPTMLGIEPPRSRSGWQEMGRPEVLVNLQTSDLIPCTFLATKTGKRIPLIRYDQPGKDMLGARFLFPRKQANGTPTITAGDRELWFETRIADKQVKVKFDLQKMGYLGKLEI
jgi:hypothetical protein